MIIFNGSCAAREPEATERRYPTSKIRSSACASLDQPCGDTQRPRSEKNIQQDARRGKFMFRINPHSCRRHSEGSNNTCVHQDPGTPKRLRQNCV